MLVDTDVFSYVVEGHPFAERYSHHLNGRVNLLSFQTVAEVLQGAYQSNWGDARLSALREELERYVIAPFRMEMVERFARLRAHRRRIGREIETADAWIAATALWLECPLVTHNRRHFLDIPELDVLSEA